MAAAEDKALIASSDFDPTQFAQGMDVMIGSLDKVIAKEAELNAQITAQQKALNTTNTALKTTTDQIGALDKTSVSYNDNLKKLTASQTQLQQQQAAQNATMKTQQDQLVATAAQADKFKTALSGITQVAAQVKASGANLFNTATLTTQLQQVNAVAGDFRNIFKGKVDTSELDDLEAKLAGTSDEFVKLREVIDFVQQKLATLDPNTQEFKDLTQVVATGNQVLGEFDKVTDRVGQRGDSVKKRLRDLRGEMQNLQAAGQEDSEAFRTMQHEAAELQDAVDKTGERIRVFSNDTRGIEAGIEAIRGVAAGFELAEGASALFGLKNDAVEESIKRLNAIMAISNGLQEISNILRKNSKLFLAAEELAVKSYTIAQRVLAATLGTTAAASRGLATALAATGIGALVIGIGILLSLLSSWESETKKLTEEQERLNEANQLGLDINQDYINQLEAGLKVEESLLQRRQAAQQKLRQSDVDRAQEAAHNAEQIRTIQQETLKGQVAQNNNELDKQRDAFEAAQAQYDKIIKERITSQTELLPALEKTIAQYNDLQRKGNQLNDLQQVQENQFARDRANERLQIQKAELAAQEDFRKRLTDLQKRLTDARDRQGRQDAAQLAQTAKDNLASDLAGIQRDVRLKNLTQARADQLKKVQRQVSGVELATTLRDFEKKAVEAQQSIEDQLLTLRLTSQATRAEALRDSLEREAATITVEYRKEFVALEVARQQALKGVQDAFDQGPISPGEFQRNTERTKTLYVQLFDDLELTTSRKREELGRLAFQQGSDLLKQLFADSGATLTDKTNQQIQALTARYTGGSIRYETYQRRLTAILQAESRKRIDQEIAENNELLAGTQRRLAAEADPAQRKTLQDQIIALREQIAQLQRQKADAEATTTKTTDDNFKADVNRVAQYAQAIGSVVEQVVRFWQLANEAEQKSLEKSIALQEQRVAAATRVAERGNAQYLRLEEDRLNELQVKQENAARKQLAINAVLQASQALVAFTTALAQGISTGGPLGGLAIAAAVLGVIASGYGIIKSLQEAQNSSTKLFKGTKRVEARHGEPSGVDTIPALLTAGEAVMPVHTANAYRPALDAIYDHQVDPAALNTFVRTNRVGRRQLARLSTDRLAEAGDVHVAFEAGLVQAYQEQGRKMDETNERLAHMTAVLKHMGVSVNLDRKGLAISMLEAAQHLRLTKKL